MLLRAPFKILGLLRSKKSQPTPSTQCNQHSPDCRSILYDYPALPSPGGASQKTQLRGEAEARRLKVQDLLGCIIRPALKIVTYPQRLGMKLSGAHLSSQHG